MHKPLIGLEIHGYLDTNEKLFCNCNNFHDMKQIKPNTNICPICTGQPGAKPMLPNASAIQKMIEICLMLNCKPNIFPKKIHFQRKHYSWPDMPTGYQRTMSGAYSIPLAENGLFEGINIHEIHLEEDPAAWNPETGTVDYNRAGVPLVEIVTKPDFTSAEQVGTWLKNLLLTLSYIKALNKDAGIKADVNINISGISEKSEIKNVNSISEIAKVIISELERHQKEKPKQRETRRWNSQKEKTELMRSKETQADYRFIPDPDLPSIIITKQRIQSISLPESPIKKLEKIIKKYKIDKENAIILTKNLEVAELYEKIIEKIDPHVALPWITIEWLSILNYNKKSMDELTINPNHIIELLQLLQEKKITSLKTKEILRKFIPQSFSPLKIALQSIKMSDEDDLRKIIKKILYKNQQSVEDIKKGENKALNFLIGHVMRETNKNADISIVKKIIEEEIK